ncbi:amino acid ABC transporter permease [Micrococcales bacterium 31B]|nr:amino acid ABC transporter permease [Micrococcales bacterium 31B]
MNVLIDNFGQIAEGFGMTLLLTVTSAVLALVIGVVIATCRVAPAASLRVFGTLYVEIVRNTPLTIVFFFFALVAPQVGIRFPTVNLGSLELQSFTVSAIVSLSLYTAAFVCEAVRSGINSVGLGQAEAARSVGMTFGLTLTQIVLPQALRTVIPPLINVFIALTKNSSVAAGFSVLELVATSRALINSFGGDTIAILTGVAIAYLVITIPLGIAAGALERKLVVAR